MMISEKCFRALKQLNYVDTKKDGKMFINNGVHRGVEIILDNTTKIQATRKKENMYEQVHNASN